jgi:hypothetical protein
MEAAELCMQFNANDRSVEYGHRHNVLKTANHLRQLFDKGIFVHVCVPSVMPDEAEKLSAPALCLAY